MNKLIAKILYPIYRELLKIHENQVKWDSFTNRHNEHKETESACAGREWSYGEAVSAELKPAVSPQYPFIDRN